MHAKRTRGLTRSHAARAARSSVPSSFTRCEEKKAKKKTRRYYSGQHYASKPKQKQHEKTSKRTRGKENPTLLIPIQPTAFIIEAFQSESALASNEPILLRLGSTHSQHPPPPPAKLEQTTATAGSEPERKIMRQRARVRAGVWMELSYIMLHNTITREPHLANEGGYSTSSRNAFLSTETWAASNFQRSTIST